jgi:hypothetical protein
MGDSRLERDYLKEKIDETYGDILFTMEEIRGLFSHTGMDTQSLGTPEREDIRRLFYLFEVAINEKYGSSDNPDNDNDDSASSNAPNVEPPYHNPMPSSQDPARSFPGNPQSRERGLPHENPK